MEATEYNKTQILELVNSTFSEFLDKEHLQFLTEDDYCDFFKAKLAKVLITIAKELPSGFYGNVRHNLRKQNKKWKDFAEEANIFLAYRKIFINGKAHIMDDDFVDTDLFERYILDYFKINKSYYTDTNE